MSKDNNVAKTEDQLNRTKQQGQLSFSCVQLSGFGSFAPPVADEAKRTKPAKQAMGASANQRVD